jgi:hypothetical protein
MKPPPPFLPTEAYGYAPVSMGVPPIRFNTVTFQMLLSVTVQGWGGRGGVQ